MEAITKTSSVSSTPDRDTPVWLASKDRIAVLKTGIASPSTVTEPFRASRMASVCLIRSDANLYTYCTKRMSIQKLRIKCMRKVRWTNMIEILRSS